MGLEKALEYYDKGILPSKYDIPEDFIWRSKLILRAASNLNYKLKRPIPESKKLSTLEIMVDEYGLDLNWVPSRYIYHPLIILGGQTEFYRYYSNKNIMHDFILPVVSVNKLNILMSTKEVLKHEYIHAARAYAPCLLSWEMMLEEGIAWSECSKNKIWNCANLALYDKNRNMLFLGLEFAGVAGAMFFGNLLVAVPFLAGAGAVFADGFIKSYKEVKKIENLEGDLKKLFGKKGKHVLIRLSKEEVEAFSKLSNDDIKKYIDKEESLKWKLIKTRI